MCGTSRNLQEADIFLGYPAQAGVRRRYVEGLSTPPRADRVSEAFLDLADGTLRPARATFGHRARARQGSSTRLRFWAFGGDTPPAAVATTASKQRDEYRFPETDAAAPHDWSWGARERGSGGIVVSVSNGQVTTPTSGGHSRLRRAQLESRRSRVRSTGSSGWVFPTNSCPDGDKSEREGLECHGRLSCQWDSVRCCLSSRTNPDVHLRVRARSSEDG